MPIKLLHDRVLVHIDSPDGERRSGGGILIPATAAVGKRLTWATAVAIGPLVLVALSVLVAGIEKRAEERTVVVSGIEHAPTLRNYLERQTYTVRAAPAGYEQQLGALRTKLTTAEATIRELGGDRTELRKQLTAANARAPSTNG